MQDMELYESANQFDNFKKRSASLIFRWIGFWFAVFGLILFAAFLFWNFGSIEAIRAADAQSIKEAWNFHALAAGDLPPKENLRLVVNLVLVILRLVFSLIGQLFGVLSFIKNTDGNMRGIVGVLINDLLFLAVIGEFLVGFGFWEL